MTACREKLKSKRLWDLSFTGSCFVLENDVNISDNAKLPFWSAPKG